MRVYTGTVLTRGMQQVGFHCPVCDHLMSWFAIVGGSRFVCMECRQPGCEEKGTLFVVESRTGFVVNVDRALTVEKERVVMAEGETAGGSSGVPRSSADSPTGDPAGSPEIMYERLKEIGRLIVRDQRVLMELLNVGSRGRKKFSDAARDERSEVYSVFGELHPEVHQQNGLYQLDMQWGKMCVGFADMNLADIRNLAGVLKGVEPEPEVRVAAHDPDQQPDGTRLVKDPSGKHWIVLPTCSLGPLDLDTLRRIAAECRNAMQEAPHAELIFRPIQASIRVNESLERAELVIGDGERGYSFTGITRQNMIDLAKQAMDATMALANREIARSQGARAERGGPPTIGDGPGEK